MPSTLHRRRALVHLLAAAFVVATSFTTAHAQSTSTTPLSRELRGIIRDKAGPVVGANVFALGTLDGATTDSTGAFAFRTLAGAQYMVAVRHATHREQRKLVPDSLAQRIEMLLDAPSSQSLGVITVQAGRYDAADEPGATLTPLEVATTPGATADVNRALQTLPGVMQVDEGTGLYVRGGDFTETRVFFNGGLLLNPAQLQQSAGTFVGTFDPFLLDHVTFISGGFGARYGDALSAIVALESSGRSRKSGISLSAGLASTALDATIAGSNGLGMRVVANRTDLTPVFRLNGATRQFTDAPHGADLTASAFWNYRPTASLVLFATQQRDAMGMVNETPSIRDTFATERRDRTVVLSWHDLFGRYRPSLTLSSSVTRNSQEFGAFALQTPQELHQVNSMLERALDNGVTLRAGIEGTRLNSRVAGSIPKTVDDQSTSARTTLYDFAGSATRVGAFIEADVRPTVNTRIVAGVRSDHTSNSTSTTIDPRLSAAWRARTGITFTSAVGVYHQRPDPVVSALTENTHSTAMPSMRAMQSVLGVQIGDSSPNVRIELYEKHYSDLVQTTRNFTMTTGGRGDARGLDVILRLAPAAGLSTRLTYSLLSATRTDPDSRAMARAPFDVTHSVAFIATQVLPRNINIGLGFRYASGRPFTPVLSAVPANDGSGQFTPTYGVAGSMRLPAFARMDLSASWFRAYRHGIQFVGYASLSNGLNRPNVFDWRYSADYRERRAIASIFNRSLYFGGVLTLGKS